MTKSLRKILVVLLVLVVFAAVTAFIIPQPWSVLVNGLFGAAVGAAVANCAWPN